MRLPVIPRRPFLGGIIVGLVLLVLLLSLPAWGHHRPSHNGGPPHATTTTQATTTTTAPTTTTTQPTTTTQTPTTTTAPAGGFELGLVNGFDFTRIDLSRVRGEDWWKAVYEAFLPSGAGWIEGDRIGYCGAYEFMVYQGNLVGRVTFVATPGATAYVQINDHQMREGLRYWDASPNSDDQAYGPGFCDRIVGQDYQPNFDPDQNPQVIFNVPGKELEDRDYGNTERLYTGLKFRLVEVIDTPFVSSDGEGRSLMVTSRRTVVADVDNNPAVAVYYDGLGGGFVTSVP